MHVCERLRLYCVSRKELLVNVEVMNQHETITKGNNKLDQAVTRFTSCRGNKLSNARVLDMSYALLEKATGRWCLGTLRRYAMAKRLVQDTSRSLGEESASKK